MHKSYSGAHKGANKGCIKAKSSTLLNRTASRAWRSGTVSREREAHPLTRCRPRSRWRRRPRHRPRPPARSHPHSHPPSEAGDDEISAASGEKGACVSPSDAGSAAWPPDIIRCIMKHFAERHRSDQRYAVCMREPEAMSGQGESRLHRWRRRRRSRSRGLPGCRDSRQDSRECRDNSCSRTRTRTNACWHYASVATRR